MGKKRPLRSGAARAVMGLSAATMAGLGRQLENGMNQAQPTPYAAVTPQTLAWTTDAPATEGPDPLSFQALISLLRRRYRLFFGVIIAAATASLLIAALLPPRYTAEARVMVDPRPRASAIAGGARSTGAPDSSLVATEVEFMSSPLIARAVAKRLDLARDAEFAAPNGPDQLEKVAANLANQVSVRRQGLTYLVAIRAQSRNPLTAAKIADAVADEYLVQSRAQRAQAAAEQARTLTAELGPLGREVLAADKAVADFRAAHGIVNSSAGNVGTINDQQIGPIAAELGRAAADAAAARAAASAAGAQASRTGVQSISQVLNSESLAELRRQRAQVLREQAQISSVYGPEHPASVRINEQLAQLDREINLAAGRVLSGLNSDAQAAERRAATMRAQLGRLEARQTSDSRAAVVAESLQRAADAKRAIYDELSRNAQEQAQEARIGDVRGWKVSPAASPLKPSFPDRTVFLMVGLLIGAAAGTGAVVVAELRQSGFRSAQEVELDLHTRFLAAVPELPPSARAPGLGRLRRRTIPQPPGEYVVRKPTSAFAESIRNVRATLRSSAADPGFTTICVTSAVAGEGKSAIALALARLMAMSGDRVLLVDGDLRRAGLSALCRDHDHPPAAADLVDVLRGDCGIREAIVPDHVPGLSLLGLTAPVFTPEDLFSREQGRQLLAALRHDYDFVVVDAPPVLAVTDAWNLASLSDATLLVVRHARTPRAAVRTALERLRRCGAPLHGVILNRRSRANGPDDAGYYDGSHAGYYVN